MAAGGSYDRHSRIQSIGLMPGVDLLHQAAAAVALPESDAAVVIADYGCSTGRNSLAPMATADGDGSAGYRPMFDAAWGALSGFVREGLIDADEAVRMGMPHFGRSAVELAAPFGDDGEFAGLAIERLEMVSGPDAFFDDYESTGDAAAFGAGWAGVFAAGAFPSLATGLNSGPDDPRTAIVFDRLTAEIADRLAESPQRMRVPVANLVLVKRPGGR